MTTRLAKGGVISVQDDIDKDVDEELGGATVAPPSVVGVSGDEPTADTPVDPDSTESCCSINESLSIVPLSVHESESVGVAAGEALLLSPNNTSDSDKIDDSEYVLRQRQGRPKATKAAAPSTNGGASDLLEVGSQVARANSNHKKRFGASASTLERKTEESQLSFESQPVTDLDPSSDSEFASDPEGVFPVVAASSFNVEPPRLAASDARPGAFRVTPTAERRTMSNPPSVDTDPLTHAASNRATSSFEPSQRLSQSSPSHHSNIDPIYMAEASLVLDEPEQATSSSTMVVEARLIRRKRQLGALVLAIIVVAAIIIGLAVGLTRSRQAEFQFPTEAPTVPPTLSPTSKLDQDIRALLPAYTLYHITTKPDSPQYKAYQFVTRHDNGAWMENLDPDRILLRRMQRFALATLFYATSSSSGSGGDNSHNNDDSHSNVNNNNHVQGWTNDTLWLNSSSSECNWFGCGCRMNDDVVIDLNLDQNELTGTMPVELELLSDGLTSLSLSGNALSGSMPTELGQLTLLTTLKLYDNVLDGSIPTEMGYITTLQLLSINQNSLTGPIPSQIGTLSNLLQLDLSFNRLRLSIPTEIGLLTNLQDLALSSNALTGEITSEVGSLTALSSMTLDSNQLLGIFPSHLENLTNVQVLYVQGNRLSGLIPPTIRSLTSLRALNLAENVLQGPLPTALGALTELTELALNSNDLTGPVPLQFTQLTMLSSLQIGNNALNGTIATEMGRLTNLMELDLSSSSLYGTIPTEFGLLTGLAYLDLTSNELESSIPMDLSDLSQLTFLGLGSNLLTGPIQPNWDC